ncbi:hypothetical protein CHLNCDRAFT_145470 [Chlorella variabilis]|uniref:Glycosyltransferase family 92 protein n=1 Tax=Chlorella variabilis TaxID=554065 RepID=E1ZEH8_CHLVA|nr:hypothetical protein CHLNCDRAFT_145470 [Chlorella variabilis]EFN56032.1 hypothetical protein CHLNCDRAFT_145470 [Chlorella variabilis]|eukprot:XP_005848134.1 hypothetical protein CHLNCDRAFT_145470 [Chlorella variabilis]
MRVVATSKHELSSDSGELLSVVGPQEESPAATAAAAATSRRRPQQPTDCRSAGPHRRDFSAKELALQAKRYKAWRAGTARGVAMCLTVKDQAEDLPEWVEYHLGLGASHIYVFDTGSRPPVKGVLRPYLRAGDVTYRYISDFKAASQDLNATNDHRYNPKYKQWIVYSLCLRDYGTRHRFMAFIDSDEFLVITDGTPDLPTLLEQYRRYGGLVANWRILGSSGHKSHQDSTLLAYTSCYPEQAPAQRAIKTIVNTALAVQPASPHNAYYVGGCHAVSTAGERVDGFSSARIRSDRLLVYHYATKSLQDFKAKMKRGGGLGVIFRKMDFWKQVQAHGRRQVAIAIRGYALAVTMSPHDAASLAAARAFLAQF